MKETVPVYLSCVSSKAARLSLLFPPFMSCPWVSLPRTSRPPPALLFNLLVTSGSWGSCGQD